MTSKTIEKLCCPFDKSDLSLQVFAQDVSNNIKEGILTCSVCKRYYPIVSGIPIMNPDEYREFKLEIPLLEKWQHHLPNTTFDNFRLTNT
ncbi:Trm112 family protein, partial [Acinetobacter baumannii]